MERKELAELLNRMDDEFFGKISQFLEKESFFNTWYEALKDYDYDLIKYEVFPTARKFWQNGENLTKIFCVSWKVCM